MANPDHAAAQMPGWMLRDHANLADAYKQHIHDGGESALGDFLRDEAARREADSQTVRADGWRSDCPKCVASKFACDEHRKPDAPPPPAPDLVARLRQGTGDGLQAWDWMREAANAIEALRARAEAAEAELRIHRERAASLNNMWRHEFSREVEAAADKLFARMAWPHKEIHALAGGNDDQGK